MKSDDTIHIRIDREKLGRNLEIGSGFSLGTTPNGYGVKWSRGPDGLGRIRCGFKYDFDQGAVKIEFENKCYVFFPSHADEATIESAAPIDFESEMNVR